MREKALLLGPTLPQAAEPSSAIVGRMEQLPKWLNLIPMVAQWVWLACRYGAVALPASANPAITAGGLVGEGKSEYFRIMGQYALSQTADFAVFENGGEASFGAAEEAMCEVGLSYPLIAKPDIGWCGFGVRLVRDAEELRSYLRRYPHGENIILQRYIAYEGEAGLYYVRHPDEPHGRVVGVLLRAYPRVVGDGRRTVGELIAAHPRAKRLGSDGLSEPCCDPSYIPAPEEIVRVSITGSTRVGGCYSDATSLITPALEEEVDKIARDMTELHVARFDIRYNSLGKLSLGRDFKIIEVNGAGSEAVHAWDPRYSLTDCYRIVFAKQRMIFAIGDAMRRRGYKPPSLYALAKLHFRQARLIACYPPSN